MSSQEPVISIKGLRKAYGTQVALAGLDLNVGRGEIFGLLGPNGAGKTTLIRILIGLIRPDQGTVTCFGETGTGVLKHQLSRIGCIVEEPRFYPYLSGTDNLWVASKSQTAHIGKQRINEMIDLVGLAGRGHQRVGTYSQGMRQRLGIARALLHDPEVVILDEPTNGLDPSGIVELRKLIIQMRDTMGKTVILSSHILSEVEQMADGMALLNKGLCVSQGRVSELLNAEQLSVSLSTDDDEAGMKVLRNLGLSPTLSDSISFDADRKSLPSIVRSVTEAGVGIYRLEHRRRLEEFFMRMTER